MNTNFKRYSILAFTILACLSSCNQKQPSQGYTLKGTIMGVEEGTVKLIQSNDVDRSQTTIDSIKIINGTFELNGQIDGPERMTLSFEPGNWSLPLFMENAEITVTADTTNAKHYDHSQYGGSIGAQLKDYTIQGSNSNDEYMEYENNPKNVELTELMASINRKFDATESESVREKLREQSGELSQQKKEWEEKWLEDFITENPTSVVGAYLFNLFYQFNRDMPIDKMEATVIKFKGEAASSTYANNLTDKLSSRKALLPGEVAPDFTALKPDSTEFTLSSTRGQYVLIDFWASWCVPCRESIPHWKEIYEQYHEKGFEIVGVTNDSKRKDWFKALNIENMPWIQVADEFPVKNKPARIGTLYMTPYLPTYVLLDKEGKIILHNGSKEEITEKIKELLG